VLCATGSHAGAELRATDASSSRGPRQAGSRDARGHRERQRRRAVSRPCRVAASSHAASSHATHYKPRRDVTPGPRHHAPGQRTASCREQRARRGREETTPARGQAGHAAPGAAASRPREQPRASRASRPRRGHDHALEARVGTRKIGGTRASRGPAPSRPRGAVVGGPRQQGAARRTGRGSTEPRWGWGTPRRNGEEGRGKGKGKAGDGDELTSANPEWPAGRQAHGGARRSARLWFCVGVRQEQASCTR
jgi:hypothetical protein